MKTNKLVQIALVFFAVFCFAGQVVALEEGSAKALDAFRRYEPDFSNAARSLEEMARKIDRDKLDLDSGRGAEIKSDAVEVVEHVQKRYDLLEDLFKAVSSDHPADRAALLDGFQRIDDLYRRSRTFFLEKFEEPVKTPSSSKSEEKKPEPVASDATSADQKSQLPAPTVKPDVEYEVAKPAEGTKNADVAKADEKSDEKKLRLHGTFRIDSRNRNENYTAQNSKLSNNLRQAKLTLSYELDPKNLLSLEEKYLERKRNELVKENVLTFGWLYKRSQRTNWSFKDTLHHVWYPEATQKDYRDNLAEIFLNRKYGKWDHVYNLGLETRVYPNYSRSDFKQLNYDYQSTYFLPNGTLFSQLTYNGRNYKNSPTLDYTNALYDVEYNRNFSGNKSEISISDTYDSRFYGNEAVNLFRTSYFDNFFRFRYDLPVSKTFTWLFEDEYQKRVYGSDEARGYAQLKLKTTAKITVDKRTRARLGHTYTFNDENTRAKAHKNHEYAAMWERKFSGNFKLKIEDTFHRRGSIVGDIMDFNQNLIALRPTWKLPNKIELTWKTDYLYRYYSALYYSDYKFWSTGIVASYAKPKKYDWQLEASSRRFSYRNSINTSTPWNNQTQPIVIAKSTIHLRDDLRLNLSASTEKTYYRQFDTISQELLWDFTRPLTITEFIGGLEYQF